jgi:hypothetical protein
MSQLRTDQSAVLLAENTALLALLSQVPRAPTNLPPYNVSNEIGLGRELSFEQEHMICTGLAFLSGISDDPNHVMAVAVQENMNPKSITIRLAINKANPNGAEGTLSKAVHGFRQIFCILSRVAHGKQQNISHNTRGQN